ncbi:MULTISPECIES: PqiB family protein [Acetobacter]|nr:MlaD family protein [Acetobacter thailandicus]MBS0980864.1 MCE family protein [Acetobacter thailandicus]MBS0985834.1 MCE family protein [Acetobacter thailandicus]MBS1004411.1 MCE family protein [Acetobacter thailandicus]NHN96022.1 MCE family protein [Acetobacter thailandicus]
MPDSALRRIRFSIIWIIPVLSIFIAGFLVWRSFANNGPEVTVIFDTADGLTSGQTQVKNKSVVLGTVEKIMLVDDMSHVEVRIRMNAGTSYMLTNRARFWVVRPRINGASITGLETLLSGAYIAFDPGLVTPGEKDLWHVTHFRGLESPPGITSDQPGQTYYLLASSIGSIGTGAPVFFRDMVVGEVLGYTMPPGGIGPVLIELFIRQPYDRYLHTDTRFWNVSGVTVGFGAGGLKVQLQSLQALFSGGVAFGLPLKYDTVTQYDAPENTLFKLYESREDAETAGYHERVPLVTYLTSSVQGLTVGSKVSMFGLQIGNVTSVKFEMNAKTDQPRVRVGMQIQPERVLDANKLKHGALTDIFRTLVQHGLRASVDSVSFLTGESMISLNFVKNAQPAQVEMDGTTLVIPGQPGGMNGIMESLSTVAARLAGVPFEQLGVNASNLLAHADQTLVSPDVRQSLTSLRASLQNLQVMSTELRKGTAPLMQSLPAMTKQLEQTIANANKLMGSYGKNTDFYRNMQTMILQLSQTARSMRFLADFLTNHPSALISGR